MASFTAATEQRDGAADDVTAFRELIRAGFEIWAFHCFVEGEPCVAWEARGSALPPLYSRSLSGLHASCKSRVAAALARRRAHRPTRAAISERFNRCRTRGAS